VRGEHDGDVAHEQAAQRVSSIDSGDSATRPFASSARSATSSAEKSSSKRSP
jgi:hypothetical protein